LKYEVYVKDEIRKEGTMKKAIMIALMVGTIAAAPVQAGWLRDAIAKIVPFMQIQR
jgi:hypothetical protein